MQNVMKYLSGSNWKQLFDPSIENLTYTQECRRQAASDAMKNDLNGKIHGKIVAQNGSRLLLTDLNSENGTFVNGSRIPMQTPVYLTAGDEIVFGKGGVKIVFDLDPDPHAAVKASSFRMLSNREHKADAGIDLSALVKDSTPYSGTVKSNEVKTLYKKDRENDCIEEFEVCVETKNSSDTASAQGFLNFSAGYPYIISLILVSVSAGYLLPSLSFNPRQPVNNSLQILDKPASLMNNDVKQDVAIRNSPAVPLRLENIKLPEAVSLPTPHEQKPVASMPESKPLAPTSHSTNIQKRAKKQSLHKYRRKNKPSSKISDPHIDEWAKHFFNG